MAGLGTPPGSPSRRKTALDAFQENPTHMVFRSGNNLVYINQDNSIGGYDQEFDSDDSDSKPDPFEKRLEDYGIVFFSPKLTTAEVYCRRTKHKKGGTQCKDIKKRISDRRNKRNNGTGLGIYMYELTSDISEFANTDIDILQKYISEKYAGSKENREHFPFEQTDKGKWVRESGNSDADYKFFSELRDNDKFKDLPGVIAGNELILFLRPGEIQIEQMFRVTPNDRNGIYLAQDAKPAAAAAKTEEQQLYLKF